MRGLFILGLLLLPEAAAANPLYAAYALIQNGVGFAPALGAAFGGTVFSKVAGAALIYSANKALAQPKAPDLVRDLQNPDTLVPYRFVYGRTRIYGSYAPVRVKQKILYACLILNSRPSSGNFALFLDKRNVELTGDLFDFSSGGAEATNAPFQGYLRAWIGRGDQIAPPVQITDEAPELFRTTDAWRGRTVLWLRLDAGPKGKRSERWPRPRPEVEVEGDWCTVWDPRDPAQDPSDETTWTFSNNQALCLLDALRQNPVRPYQAQNLRIDTFAWGADVADQAVALKSGGAEPRYTTNGVLVFREAAEIEDQVLPLAIAGAGDLIRVGGQLAYAPGVYKPPSYTLTSMVKGGHEFTRYRRGRDLPTRIRTTYVAKDRGYESAELTPWDIPGALAEDGNVPNTQSLQLELVTSPTQAMRVRNITGRKARRQKLFRNVAPPTAFNVIAGATADVALAAPYSAFNGTFEVADIHPAFDLIGKDGWTRAICRR